MNGSAKTWVVLGLIAAFGSGWLLGQIQNVNKVSPFTAWADQWVESVSLLTLNGRSTELLKPEQIPLIVGFGLNAQSVALGKVYDTLPAAVQQRLMFDIPAARAIATAQLRTGCDAGQTRSADFR